MSTMKIPTLKFDIIDLKNYVSAYGHIGENAKQKACEIANETIKKVIQEHGETIKNFQDLDEAGSYILSCVSNALEDKTLEDKIEAASQILFSDKDNSDFFNAVEWGAIDCLTDMLKNHRI